MKTHNEFLKEVLEITKPKTLAERTHDAFSELDDGGKR